MVQRRDDEIRVQWFYDTKDESRTFAISCTHEEALIIGPGWAEFFWNYISTDREKDPHSVRNGLALPHSVAGDSCMYRNTVSVINLTKTNISVIRQEVYQQPKQS